MTTYYLQHHIQQSSGFIKVAEYAADSLAAVAQITDEIVARYPTDAAVFTLRAVNHSVRIG